MTGMICRKELKKTSAEFLTGAASGSNPGVLGTLEMRVP
jgi:hypothetical protein